MIAIYFLLERQAKDESRNPLLRFRRIQTFDRFYQKHWKKDHIFVKSKQALDFQHLDKKINAIISS